MNKKKVIAIAAICSIIATPFNTYGKGISEQTDKQYLVLRYENSNYKVHTFDLSYSEMSKMKKDKNNLVIEEDSYVYGSQQELSNIEVNHESNTNDLALKDSETEWNLQMINADSVVRTPESKIKVALIDSGVDYTDDIDVYKRKNFIPGEDNVSVLYEDSSGHGTSISGIMAAKDNDEGITGINPNIELYSARVLDHENKAPISRVIDAIYWAIEENVNIINISFGTTTNSEALRHAIQDAYNAGILIVAAAGNNGTIEYPAAYDEVVAVGAVNSKGERSEGSAMGAELELMAPGEQILSTGAFGGVSVSEGTSMAAPHVVGVASILWEKDLSSSRDFIRKLLDVSANKYGDSNEYGYGLIDLGYALEVYDDFKNSYNSVQASSINDNNNYNIENNCEITVFEDIDYVTGSWATSKHEELAGTGNVLSAAALAVVKLGAAAPDKAIYNIQGMGVYPQWHGFTSWTDASGTKQYCNYMASYILLTRVALGFPKDYTNSNTFTAPAKPSYMSQADYNNINGKATATTFCGVLWKDVLGSNGVTDRNKRLYMYGTALHTATDLFSHSTYLPDTTYINHDSGADTWTYIANRSKCATEMARALITRISGYTAGDVSDFAQAIRGTYDGTFKIPTYATKANAINSTYYNSNKALFDSISNY